MTVIQSNAAVGSEEFAANDRVSRQLVATLEARRAEREAWNPKASNRHEGLGKLLPRDRVDSLLDPGSPFYEVNDLAGIDMYQGVPPGL